MARHRKQKELTAMQKRALKVGAMAPVSAGFVLAAATGAFAACPATQAQQPTQAVQQNPQGTQISSVFGNAVMDQILQLASKELTAVVPQLLAAKPQLNQ
ncbi:hypothetical protein [Streptomyces sp. L2]|uniref:hypothetical protein n=1 Tax=Streptomyces sp. L2 TaxID=2162665 RepID=UPI0010102B62|nr:hypothetical protein [Streptomyces sp. L2]